MVSNHFDEYGEIYKLNMNDEWMNAAYDEDGDSVVCDLCGAEMRWSDSKHMWVCPDCEREMDRCSYFDYIGANPPGSICLTNCQENYPFCKKYCENYDISPDDPMLD